MTEKITIELSERDLKKILCEKFNLDLDKAELLINKSKGDRPFDMDFTEIKITSIKK